MLSCGCIFIVCSLARACQATLLFQSDPVDVSQTRRGTSQPIPFADGDFLARPISCKLVARRLLPIVADNEPLDVFPQASRIISQSV